MSKIIGWAKPERKTISTYQTVYHVVKEIHTAGHTRRIFSCSQARVEVPIEASIPAEAKVCRLCLGVKGRKPRK